MTIYPYNDLPPPVNSRPLHPRHVIADVPVGDGPARFRCIGNQSRFRCRGDPFIMFRDIRRCWLRALLLCLCLITGAARADTTPPPPAPPPGMTPQQYDALVKSVGESVLQTLEAKGLVAKTPPAAAPAAASGTDAEAVL